MHGGDIYRNSIRYDFSVNLNPKGVPPEVQWVLTEAALHANKYPDIYHQSLVEETSCIFDIPENQIVYGNGASEIIMAVCHGINPKKAFLIAPCFSGYESCIKGASTDCEISYYTLLEENGFAVHHDILEHIQVQKPKLMFITNPNNPNGLLVEQDLMGDIIRACESAGTTLVIDECFLPLTGREQECSYAYNIADYKSLIVLRAYTKTFAIPGVRIGYALCSTEALAKALKDHLPEWNLSMFAQMAGMECLKHQDYLEESVRLVETERSFLVEGLKRLGFTVYDSNANYIMFKSPDIELEKKLLQFSILIRDCSDYNGLEKGFYRIGLKNRKENEVLLSALEEVINAK